MKILQQFDLLIKEWRYDMMNAKYPSDMMNLKEKYLGKHGKVFILKNILNKMPADERAYLKKYTSKLEEEMQKAYNMRTSDFGMENILRKIK